MPNWIFIAMGTAVLLASADVFVKLASGKLSNSVVLVIFGICTFSIGISWVVWQRFHGVPQFIEPRGALAAIAMGITFSFVTIGLYLTFGAGAPISLASPLIRLGGLLLASFAGLMLFQEPFSWRYGFGVLMVCSGLYFIITR